MKRILLFLLAFNITFTALAQLSDYITDLLSPVGLAQDGTTLYIADVGQSKILQVDMTATNPIAEDFVNNVSFATKMVIIGNELYFTSLSIGGVAKVDITSPNPTVVNVIVGLDAPFGIAIKDNFMYLSLRNNGSIVRFDYTQTNPTAETVITGLGSFLNDITINGNDLYMARGQAGIISRIDISQTSPMLEDVITVPGVLDVLVHDGYLYYSNFFLSRIDLSESTPTPESLISPLSSSSWDTLIDGSNILLAQQTGNKISRLNTTFIDPSLSPDYNTLVDIYNGTDGDNWSNNSNWFNPSVSLYSWHGVTIDENNKVIGLNLSDNGLSGNIPSEVGALDMLETLVLNNNLLVGELPGTIFTLSDLESLWLSNNDLTGNLSPSIGNLTNLTTLYLENNQFSGNIPTEFGNLTNLIGIRLDGNEFGGNLPSSLSNINDATSISISNNNFEGGIPFNAPNANIFATNNLFDFSDLEPFISAGNYNFFDYSPQRTPDDPETIAIGTSQNLTLSVDDTNINRVAQSPAMNNQFQWFKDDVAIAGANSNSYEIMNTQESDSGIYHCEITNTIVADLVIVRADIMLTVDASLTTIDNEVNEFKIYPNPVNDWLTIDLGNQQDASLAIYDINGKLISEQNISTTNYTTDVSYLESGFYIATLTSEYKTLTMRLLKQ